MPGREIIQIHIGQAGVQMANACWELYCLEHAIKCDGTLYDQNCCEDYYSSFFAVTSYGQVVPRVVMMDLEPTVIDEIRTGCYRYLFNPGLLLTGKEDGANNFAIGKYGIGTEMLGLAIDRTRQIVEDCGNLQGFIVFRSYGGGTGGGLGSLFLQALNDEFNKLSIFEFVVFPSPRLSNIIVEPYNTVLSTHSSTEYHDLSIILDNEAMYNIICDQLTNCKPTYTNLNRIIGQVASNVTASLRFEGAINVDLQELQTNLVPFKRIHFPLVSYAPFVPYSRAIYEQLPVATLTNSCFQPGNQLATCDPKGGAYMSCCLLYRGDMTPVDINNAIVGLKKKNVVQFVDWSPTGFKVGINYMPPVTVPGGDLAKINRAVTMLGNSTAIKLTWKRLLAKYNIMLHKRAFLHHYVGEGMEESEFFDAQEDLVALVADYKEIEE